MPDTQIPDEMVRVAHEAFFIEKERQREGNSGLVVDSHKAMRAALTAALSGHVVDWRTMDSAPKDGSPIDVWFDLGNGQAARWANVRWDSLRERWSGGPTDQGLIHWNPTHWQPLRAPPVPVER